MTMKNKNKIKLVAALIFLMFDFNMSQGSISFNLFPTFIGFFLLYTCLGDLEKKSKIFTTLKSYSFAMSFIFFVTYIVNMFGLLDYLFSYLLKGNQSNEMFVSGLKAAFTSVQLALNLALTLLMVYGIYLLMAGFREVLLKKESKIAKYGRQLMNTFQIFLVLKGLYLVSYILYIFAFDKFAMAPAIFNLTSYVPSVVLITQFRKTHDLL